jgi:AcrR family transcriptional regulator
MPKIVDKEAKKLEILHAAMFVFARKGIVNTKMIDIAREAGVGKGTIYEYFPSKEGIFISAYHFMFEMTENEIKMAMASTDDPLKKLELILDITFNSFMGHGGEFAAILMDFWAEGVRKNDSKVLEIIDLKGAYEQLRQLVSSILKEGIKQKIFRKMDVNLVSAVLLGALDGVALQWIMDRKAINLEKVTSVIIDSFLNGIKL